MGWFNRGTSPDRRLEQMCTQMLQGMGVPPREVGRVATDLIQQAKQDSEREGTSDLPADYGDKLLAQESTDPSTKAMLDKKRAEGVTDADVRWWWNLPDVERRVMDSIEELNRGAMFIKYRSDGMSADQAGVEMRKYQPIYGDPDDTSVASGEDRPIPYELMDRVNRHVAQRRERIALDIAKSTSFNALVRDAIRRGAL